MSNEIDAFKIAAPDADLEDLKRRLRATRWPERECVDDWSQGLLLPYAQEVCAYWQDKYEWPAREARLNRFAQLRTAIDGLGIHFIHMRSPATCQRDAAGDHPWMARLDSGVSQGYRAADEPRCALRRCGRRVSYRMSIASGLWLSDKPSRTGGTSNASRARGPS
jgi:Epoxide hydrolase N terminus